MAGIGFELRKAITRGGIGSFVKVAFSGIMIVAGPWLLSIVGITTIQRFMSFAVKEAPEHFMGVIIYSYAWSMVLSGGLHFVYTRMMADMLFSRKEREAAGALVFFLVPTFIAALAISSAFAAALDAPVADPLLFRASAVVLFVSINLIWLLMIFISLLKWYVRILVIYTTGLSVSLLLVYLLGRAAGTAGALAGYAAGHLGIALLLMLLSFIAHRPKEVWSNARRFLTYMKRFFPLFATGMLYSWAVWVDKIVYWITLGERAPGTFISLFGRFDIAVYVANLSMIPGLVYFVIDSETSFYLALRSFLVSLGRGTYAEIQRRKNTVMEKLTQGVIDQSFFQGVISAALIALSPALGGMLGLETATLRIVLVGVFFHLMFLTLMNFTFYLEYFRHALAGSALFFLVNLAGALTSLPGLPLLPPGVSYLAGAAVAAVFTGKALFVSGRRMDRIILAKISGV